eukprot:tig00021687_g23111.t1
MVWFAATGRLDLRDGNLTEWPTRDLERVGPRNVTALFLSGNEIARVPASVAELVNLEAVALYLRRIVLLALSEIFKAPLVVHFVRCGGGWDSLVVRVDAKDPPPAPEEGEEEEKEKMGKKKGKKGGGGKKARPRAPLSGSGPGLADASPDLVAGDAPSAPGPEPVGPGPAVPSGGAGPSGVAINLRFHPGSVIRLHHYDLLVAGPRDGAIGSLPRLVAFRCGGNPLSAGAILRAAGEPGREPRAGAPPLSSEAALELLRRLARAVRVRCAPAPRACMTRDTQGAGRPGRGRHPRLHRGPAPPPAAAAGAGGRMDSGRRSCSCYGRSEPRYAGSTCFRL